MCGLVLVESSCVLASVVQSASSYKMNIRTNGIVFLTFLNHLDLAWYQQYLFLIYLIKKTKKETLENYIKHLEEGQSKFPEGDTTCCLI